MSTFWRKSWVVMSLGALLLLLVTGLPGDSSAANLTGGNYTYVIGGEEVSFPVDPISRKDGLLLPAEVMQRFNITIDGALTRTITLKRGDVTLVATLGATVVDANGKSETIPTAPLRLSGRLFLPADLLKYFGIDYALDATYVIMKDNAEGVPAVRTLADADYQALKTTRGFTASAKADTNIFLNGDFTILNSEIVMASNLDITQANRVKLYNMLQTNTLVLVKLSNTYFKAGALATSSLYVVDAQRKQYDLASVLDIGDGLLSAKLAPGADRLGVLVFPKVRADGGGLTLYYDAGTIALGTFAAQ